MSVAGQVGFGLVVCWIIANMGIMLGGAGIGTIGAVLLGGSSLLRSLYQPRMYDILVEINGRSVNPEQYLDTRVIFGTEFLVGIMVFGFFLFFWALWGTFIASCPRRWTILLYIIFMAVYLAAIVTGLILYFAFGSNLNDYIKQRANWTIANRYRGDSYPDTFSRLVTFVARDYDCCGVDDYRNFEYAKYWNRKFTINTTVGIQRHQLLIPLACCRKGQFMKCVEDIQLANLNVAAYSSERWNKLRGCWPVIMEKARLPTVMTCIALGCLALLVGFAITLAFLLLAPLLSSNRSSSPYHSSPRRPTSHASTYASETRHGYTSPRPAVTHHSGALMHRSNGHHMPPSAHSQSARHHSYAPQMDDPVSRWHSQFGSRYYDKRIFENYANGLQ